MEKVKDNGVEKCTEENKPRGIERESKVVCK